MGVDSLLAFFSLEWWRVLVVLIAAAVIAFCLEHLNDKYNPFFPLGFFISMAFMICLAIDMLVFAAWVIQIVFKRLM